MLSPGLCTASLLQRKGITTAQGECTNRYGSQQRCQHDLLTVSSRHHHLQIVICRHHHLLIVVCRRRKLQIVISCQLVLMIVPCHNHLQCKFYTVFYPCTFFFTHFTAVYCVSFCLLMAAIIQYSTYFTRRHIVSIVTCFF